MVVCRSGCTGSLPCRVERLSSTALPVAASHRRRAMIRTVALFEGFKGIVVLLTASGLLALLHRNLHALAASFIAHMHLNPAARYPTIFLDAISRVDDSNLVLLACGAAVYAFMRLVEAYGLLLERAWAEWLAAVSGIVYIPIELFELVSRPALLGAAVLLINFVIVAVMVRALGQRRAAIKPVGGGQ